MQPASRFHQPVSTVFNPGRISLISLSLWIDATAAADNTGAPAAAVTAADVLNLVVGLVFVIIIFLGIAYLLQRLTGGNAMSRGYLQLVDALHLGTREKIILVRVVDRCLVLGVSPGHIVVLDAVAGQLPETLSASHQDFRARLRSMLAVARSGQG